MNRIILASLILLLVTVACGAQAQTPETRTGKRIASTLTVTVTPTQAQTRTLCGMVNVRGGPSADGRALRSIEAGRTVTIFEWSGTWARIGEGEWITGKVVCK